MPKNVIVVGMPRSGTSMLTGIFARAGFFVAQDAENDLRVPDRANPEGYWEAQPLVDRNVEVLTAAGFEHHNTWLFPPIGSEHVTAIGRLAVLPGHAEFVDSYRQHAPWVWKDPRLSYTLRYWWPLMDPADTRVLLIKRDAAAIVRSFVRLGWCDPTEAAADRVRERIASHVSAAEAAMDDLRIPSLVLDYDSFGEDGSRIANALGEFVGVALTSADLRYNKRYNHSTVRGRLGLSLERIGGGLPRPLRRGVKSLVPSQLLRWLFPGT